MKFSLDIKALSLNNCYRGMRYKTHEKKSYDQIMQLLIPKKSEPGPYYKVSLSFFMKRCFGGDVDNLCKGVLDNLVTRGVINEDRNVVEIRLRKYPSPEDRIDVEVESIEKWP